jgi:MFS family permease
MQRRSREMLGSFRAMSGLFLSGFFLFGIGVYSFTQFLGPLHEEFGWGRAALGALMSAFWIAAPFAVIGALLLPRIGVRRVVFVGAVLESGSLALMVLARHEWQFVALRFFMGAGKVLIATPIPVMAALWFKRRPGLAIAISLCGWHVGGLVMAPLSAWLIASVGWRSAAIQLSLVFVAGMVCSLLLLRPPLETAQDAVASASATTPPEAGWTPPWGPLFIIGAGTIVFYIGYAGVLAQLSPLLGDCGFSVQAIGKLVGSVAISAAVGVLVAGFITQMLTPRVSGGLILGAMALTAAGAVAMGPHSPPLLAVGVIVLLGALVGGGDPILVDSLRQLFPARIFNRAYGWWYLVCLTALGVAPFLVGLVFDRSGSYRAAFLGISVLCAITMICWLAGFRVPKRAAQRA